MDICSGISSVVYLVWYIYFQSISQEIHAHRKPTGKKQHMSSQWQPGKPGRSPKWAIEQGLIASAPVKKTIQKAPGKDIKDKFAKAKKARDMADKQFVEAM